MKKAYVKPVFIAEEFAAASSYAAGTICGVSMYTPYGLTAGEDWAHKNDGTHLCTADGHWLVLNRDRQPTKVGSAWHIDESMTNWEYATADGQATLFIGKECDFVWDPSSGPNGAVSVWDDVDVDDRNELYTGWENGGKNDLWGFLKFFTGKDEKDPNHLIPFDGNGVAMS